MKNSIPAKVRKEFKCLTDLKCPEDLSLEKQKDMFFKMNLIRQFDLKVMDLWINNKIFGVCHSYVGAEANAVGACAALESGDYITSTHRGHGHCIAKGADPNKMMAELFGKYEGYNKGKGGSMHLADVEHGMLGATGIVGSGIPIALGSALASDFLGNKKVTICFHGDGSTNTGSWHESINMAATWKLPVIFLVENNQMSIATNFCMVSKEGQIYKRAIGYGIPGIQVDGFNIFEVYKAVKAAVDRARSGEGPILIESKYLRLLGHGMDDTQWYRNMKDVEPYWELCPIKRMRQYFINEKLLQEKEIDAIKENAEDVIAHAVEYALNECTEPTADTLYEDIYAHGEIIR